MRRSLITYFFFFLRLRRLLYSRLDLRPAYIRSVAACSTGSRTDHSCATRVSSFPSPSEGHCTFEGGMCGWTNQEEGDDFEWILARGSDNFFTGPARDYYSFSKEYPLGGFLYIDAAYPRRPGDRALLVSPTFEATGTSCRANSDATQRAWRKMRLGGVRDKSKERRSERIAQELRVALFEFSSSLNLSVYLSRGAHSERATDRFIALSRKPSRRFTRNRNPTSSRRKSNNRWLPAILPHSLPAIRRTALTMQEKTKR